MEIIFGLISLLISAGILFVIPYMVYGNWVDVKRILNEMFNGDGTLGYLYLVIGLLFAIIIFIMFCAINNTFWYLDYLK